MGKKHKHPEHENLERWLVSYADFITLLFATFTALYAIASNELNKMEDVAKAIREGFQKQSLISGINSIMQGKSPPADNPNPLSKEGGGGAGVMEHKAMFYQPGEVEDIESTVKKLQGDVKDINDKIKDDEKKAPPKPIVENPDDQKPPTTGGNPKSEEEGTPNTGLNLAVQERGVKVSFDSRLLFYPGKAELKPESYKMLGQIAERLRRYSKNNLIYVEGHTDNQPIHSVFFPSNWELSTARASTVVRTLVRDYHFSPQLLVAAGYADTRPIDTNTTPEGRARNRRIDIVLYSKNESMKNDPKKQWQSETSVVDSPEGKPALRNKFPKENPLSQSEDEDLSVKEGPVKIILKPRDGSSEIKPITIIPKQRMGEKESIIPEIHREDAPAKAVPVTEPKSETKKTGH